MLARSRMNRAFLIPITSIIQVVIGSISAIRGRCRRRTPSRWTSPFLERSTFLLNFSRFRAPTYTSELLGIK